MANTPPRQSSQVNARATGFSPVPRAAPAPISSGLSFRALPEPSLAEIIRSCKHYERKCGGKYTKTVPAARFLFQLSQEVQVMATTLRKHETYETRRIRELEQTLDQWKDLVGSNSSVSSPEELIHVFQDQRDELQKSRQEIADLRKALERAREITHAEREKIELDTIMDKNEQITEIKSEHVEHIKELKRQHEEQSNCLRMENEEQCMRIQLEQQQKQERIVSEYENSLIDMRKELEIAQQEATYEESEKEAAIEAAKQRQLKDSKHLQQMQNQYETKIQNLEHELQRNLNKYQTELAQLRRTLLVEFEDNHQSEVQECRFVRRENQYLMSRNNELQKLVQRLQKAINLPEYKGQDVHADPRRIDSFAVPLVVKQRN